MEQTSNYQLNVWDEEDRIQREDFNADNAKTEQALAELAGSVAEHTAALAKCGNCKIWTTTYTGTGEAGSSNPNTLTFPAQPVFVRIAADNGVRYAEEFYGCPYINMRAATGVANCPATWNGTTLSWYFANNATNQLNEQGKTYHVMALIAM